MQVRNSMTGAAAVTHPDEPVVAAARLMRMRGIGALPVCEDDGTLAGMLTDRDIVVRCVSSRNLYHIIFRSKTCNAYFSFI